MAKKAKKEDKEFQFHKGTIKTVIPHRISNTTRISIP